MTRELDSYHPEDVTMMRGWVSLCADLIAVEPRVNVKRLHAALDTLARQANEQYARLATEDQVHLHPDPLDELGLPASVNDIFTALTGSILFNADDGPLAAARVLHGTIDKIHETTPKEQ